MLEVKLHDIGEGMTEGEILHYFVKPGDKVNRDQPLIEVQTDKVTAELPSPAAGVVKEILVAPGTTVKVGTTLLVIESEAMAALPVKKPVPLRGEEIGMQKQLVLTPPKGGRILAVPYTRKIARENGVDIEQLIGTGPGGRITEEDVLRYASCEPAQLKKEEPEIPVMKAKLPPAERVSIPFKGRRKQIAKKMVHSLKTIPHVTHFEEIDMTELLQFRKELKALGQNVSAAAFFIKAAAIALQDFPVFNAKLDEENEVILLEQEKNIGLAADSEDGLIVPVIHRAETKTIKQIHSEMKELTKKAQENKLSSSELTGGTFTISNVGPLGSIGATPVINHPETGLMAFHATKEKPVVKNGEIVIGWVMNVSMSFDHRVADGAHAVAFTNRFKELIENPKLLILELV
ncbi:2-oxo acid dehydrogenase subunit E2 [Metabacillus sp. GX 13764]|uniref:dihydrolipoamide acetyltransferase family protein n=1 Tax=Metabacillus kandeliae TaxID=2900151 RepID=UPI001E44C8BB|nr:dihydrolipoamide acetyltransferase family protein [Metabacillus kandeliae]MCD7036480.1 2-oxo acid dehydrogenase subunit E2 [Metabacillus kandeliae]